MDFIDAGTRKLFHAELQTKGIDFNTNEVKLKPQLLQYNGRLQKFYYKRLQVFTPIGRLPVDTWKVCKPSDDLIKAYEIKKRKFTDTLNKRILHELEDEENKNNNTKELTEVQQQYVNLLTNGLTIKQISEKLSVCSNSVYASIRLIQKKGYKIEKDIKDGLKVEKYKVTPPI
jgi:biotin operon repressor